MEWSGYHMMLYVLSSLYFISSPVIATLGSVFKLRKLTVSSSAFWKQLFIGPLKYFWVVFMSELILLLPTYWIFVSETLNFLACIAVAHFIGVINQHYFKVSWSDLEYVAYNLLPQWRISITEGWSFLFWLHLLLFSNPFHVLLRTVLFNSAQCNLALHTDAQDKSTHVNTKFKEEISSYIWINME